MDWRIRRTARRAPNYFIGSKRPGFALSNSLSAIRDCDLCLRRFAMAHNSRRHADLFVICLDPAGTLGYDALARRGRQSRRHDRISLVGIFNSSLQPLCQPGLHLAVPETAVLALHDPVIGLRENDQLARHLQALKVGPVLE